MRVQFQNIIDMRLIINFVLILLIILLGYMLYNSINEPILFNRVKNQRKEAVADRLKQVRSAQEIYRLVKGKYASDFDSLIYTLRNERIAYENIEGDPDDPTNTNFIRTVTYSAAIDTVNKLGIVLDSLPFVPFSGGKKFELRADKIEYQGTIVDVVEVGTRWKEFMGEYGLNRYKKYDSSYDPDGSFKFGDLSRPIISGNWE